jgi:phage/plasmid-like protein (TIGR03299 family)
MAHQIETHGDKAAFVSYHESAWHQLGTVVEEALTAEKALELAHLTNWNVRKVGIQTVDGVEIADKFATVRDNPFVEGQVDALGVVGNKYVPIQNEHHAELLNALVDQSGAHFETAGSLRNGREIFITMKMPEAIKVGDVDPVEMYLAAFNSHDGSKPFRFVVSPVRVVCANTLAIAEGRAVSSFSVRHTRNGEAGVIAQAREALGMTWAYVDEFQKAADDMIQKELDSRKFSEIISQLYPYDEDASDGIKERAFRTWNELSKLFVEAPTNENIRGTVWSGYQAVTEYIDHYANVKGKVGVQADQHRASQILLGAADAKKQQAFKMFAGV